MFKLNIRNINLLSLAKDLVRSWWLILMVAAIGTIVTHSYIKNTFEPTYTSQAIYVVTPKQSTGYVYTNTRFAESVITVFQNLLDSDIMTSRIKKELKVSELKGTRTLSLVEGTNLMRITVTSDDPIISFKSIECIMEKYSELSEYLTNDAVFDRLQEPVVSTNPDNSLTPRKKSFLAGFVCAVITMLILAAISILRTTIKTESAVEDQLGTTLLGTIIHEKKNKTVKAKIVQSVKALLITSPIISGKFVESINNIRLKFEYEKERHPDRNVLLVSSVCENEGKSTVAINIAISLAREGKKVLVIDADLRKPAMYKMMEIPKSDVVDMVKLLQGECGLDEVIYKEKSTNINFILSSKGHGSTYEFMKSRAMKDLVKKCRKIADYVIIDTPPMSMVSDTEAILDYVDFSLLVVRQDFSYEKDIKNCINIMNNSYSKFLGVVLNDYKILKLTDGDTIKSLYSDDKEVRIYE